MSRTSINLGNAAKFVAACQKLGVEGPASVTRALQAIDVASAHAAHQTSFSVLDMSADEIRRTMIELSIKRHAGVDGQGSGLAAGLEAITAAVQIEVREAALPELELIVEQLRPRFDQLAAAIVTGARRHGFTLTTTAEQVIDRADDTATASWRAARKAWTDLEPIVRLRRSMNEVFHLRPTEDDLRASGHLPHRGLAPNFSVLFAADDNWGMADEFMAGSGLDWFALAHGGLRLNTPAEVDEKVNRRRIKQANEMARVVVPETSVVDRAIASGRYSTTG